MKTNRMYDELAYLWPLISPREEYATEARYWRNAPGETLRFGFLRGKSKAKPGIVMGG